MISSHSLEAIVDSLVVSDFNIEGVSRLVPANTLDLKIKRLSSIKPMTVIVDDKKELLTKGINFKKHRPTIQISDCEVTDEYNSINNDEHLIIPLATYVWKFYQMFINNFDKQSFFDRDFFMDKRGEVIGRSDLIRGATFATTGWWIKSKVSKTSVLNSNGEPIDNLELLKTHRYILDVLEKDSLSILVARGLDFPTPTFLRYNELSTQKESIAKIELQNGDFKKERTRKKYSIKLDGEQARTMFDTCVILLNETTMLGRNRFLLPYYSREPVSLTTINQMRCNYARFSGFAPNVIRSDGLLTGDYKGPIVEQVSNASFRNFQVITTTTEFERSKIGDILNSPFQPPVKLVFSYKGGLYTPEMDLPAEFGTQI